MEIGVDCIEIKRFFKYKNDFYFLSKIFTEKEINYCKDRNNSCQHYAARYAGKEAVMKAISHFGIQLSPVQIEILNDTKGIPYVTINAEHCGKYKIRISLSHSDEIAIAFVVMEE